MTDPTTVPATRYHNTHVCRDCGAEITLPYARPVFDRLMELWQQPWSEAAFGEAQMLLSRLRAERAAPLDVDRLARAIAEAALYDDLTDAQIDAEAVAREYDRLAATPQADPAEPGLRAHLDFCSGGEFCTLDDCLCECHITATEPDGLDVETLSDALAAAGFHGYVRDDVRKAAAEYARLRESGDG